MAVELSVRPPEVPLGHSGLIRVSNNLISLAAQDPAALKSDFLLRSTAHKKRCRIPENQHPGFRVLL